MTRLAGQDKFDAFIAEALKLLDDGQASAIILCVSAANGEHHQADFAGNEADRAMAFMFGHSLGQSLMHEPDMGEVIINGIKKGSDDAKAGTSTMTDVGSSQTTRH